MLRRGVVCFVVAFFVLTTRLNALQLKNVITDLFTFGNCGEPLCLDIVGSQHGSHFLTSASASNATVIEFITGAIAANVSTFPVSATSSGVTFKFVGGLPVATSQSMGPIFTERAQTLGKGRFLLGTNLSGIRFKTIRGVPLDNLLFNFTHQDVPPPGLGDPTFENDVIQVQMSIYTDVLANSFIATYGLLNNVDIGVAVPLVSTSIEGRSTAAIITFDSLPLHFFGGTQTNPVMSASTASFGSATGIGDVLGRVKIGIVDKAKIGVSVLGDVRFPTGDADDLLGSGEWSATGVAIVSSQFGGFAPHLNVGYQYWTGDVQNDAITAFLGFDQIIAPWCTLAADALSYFPLGDPTFTVAPPVTYTKPYVRTVEPTTIPDRTDNRVLASLGFKFSAGPAIFITNALIPIYQGAMEPSVAWTAGVEFNF